MDMGDPKEGHVDDRPFGAADDKGPNDGDLSSRIRVG